jgi:Kelch motif protein
MPSNCTPATLSGAIRVLRRRHHHERRPDRIQRLPRSAHHPLRMARRAPAMTRRARADDRSAGRDSPGAAVLPDGDVIVAGGRSMAVFLSSVDRFDAATGVWSATGGDPHPAGRHAALRPRDGPPEHPLPLHDDLHRAPRPDRYADHAHAADPLRRQDDPHDDQAQVHLSLGME